MSSEDGTGIGADEEEIDDGELAVEESVDERIDEAAVEPEPGAADRDDSTVD